MFSKLFLIDAFERSVKTIAQTIVATLLASEAIGLFAVNWGDIMSVAGLAGVISILTSIASSQTGDNESASLVVATKEEGEL